jgi:hypothetical protein
VNVLVVACAGATAQTKVKAATSAAEAAIRRVRWRGNSKTG